MTIGEIFTKPVDRHIEGVIKADDAEDLLQEVEEYVITDEVNRRLHRFFEEYKDNISANGVWISGFFGSGKSHLLKMLSYLLENKKIQGKPMLEYFLEKCPTDDAVFIADIKKAVEIPSRSILFNIDQKAFIKSKKDVDAVLSVFEKVFNEMCGFYGKQGYIAKFERDLTQKQIFVQFKEAFQQVAGIPWERGRERAPMESHHIDKAYAQVTGVSTSPNLIKNYRDDYNLTIEDFAQMVDSYIKKQEPGFRLNFFVDEVGQYIADNVKLMTNLQTIAESLNTKCKGQAWLIVTAQEDMSDIIGDLTKQQGNDFSKIQDRFSIRLKLTSANVEEVIRKRLLIKNQQGIPLLSQVYDTYHNDFQTRFDFIDGSKRYKVFADAEEFIHTYPFVKYQFPLFQSAIQNLSLHNAFEGKHSSVGERSMLGVFQLVAKQVASESIGTLASFDMMYEGISSALKTQIQSSVNVAVQHLSDNPYAIKLLKVLFLVKYIKEFKSTVANLTVLMCSSFEENPLILNKKIMQALEILENQSYIQRNGDTYEFLTDEEKDIEDEIKNTDYTNGEIYETLQELLYSGALGNFRKVQFGNTNQSYAFTQKIDDESYSRDQELSIRIITPFHDRFEQKAELIAESLQENGLYIILQPQDKQFVRELIRFKKTAKFIKQNQAGAVQESVLRILKDKSNMNSLRYLGLQRMIEEMFAHAEFYVRGFQVEPAQGPPRVRVTDAFQEVINQVYPNLRYLHNRDYNESLIQTIIEQDNDLLFSTESVMNEADNEVFGYIQSKSFDAHRVSVKGLIDKYERSPFGWYLSAILCVIAELFAYNKIEIKRDSNVLEKAELISALKNNRLYDNLIVIPQVEYTQRQIHTLKEFYKEYFNKPAKTQDAKRLGQETEKAFSELYEELLEYVKHKDSYPFLEDLELPLKNIKKVCSQSYDYYLLTLPSLQDSLFDDKEDIIDYVLQFFSGSKKDTYLDARTMLKMQEANAPYVDAALWAEIVEIVEDSACYKGNRMVRLKELADSLADELNTVKQKELDAAEVVINQLKVELKMYEEFTRLTEENKALILNKFELVSNEVSLQKYIPNIRAIVQEFKDEGYTRLLQRIDTLVAQQNQIDGVKERIPVIEYISISNIMVRQSKSVLSNETDVEEYVNSYKKSLLQQIRDGKKIRV